MKYLLNTSLFLALIPLYTSDAFFNGVYIKDDTQLQANRPIYVEASKKEFTPYEQVIPATISYCKEMNSYVFMHQDIRKSKTATKVRNAGALCTPSIYMRCGLIIFVVDRMRIQLAPPFSRDFFI